MSDTIEISEKTFDQIQKDLMDLSSDMRKYQGMYIASIFDRLRLEKKVRELEAEITNRDIAIENAK